jgi:hypothetical protein
MLDTHHSHHGKSIPSLILEVAMIVVGVFLGLAAEQWREGRHEHELALASLRNFRAEIIANQAQIAEVRPYHEALAQNLRNFTQEKTPHTLSRFMTDVRFQGMRTVTLEHTAWDLALATQALSYMKPEMAYTISRLYTGQQTFQTIENGFMQSAFTPNTFADTNNTVGLTIAMMAYMGDVNIQEPSLLKAYKVVLPKLDSAIGDHPQAHAPAHAAAHAAAATPPAPHTDSATH